MVAAWVYFYFAYACLPKNRWLWVVTQPNQKSGAQGKTREWLKAHNSAKELWDIFRESQEAVG